MLTHYEELPEDRMIAIDKACSSFAESLRTDHGESLEDALSAFNYLAESETSILFEKMLAEQFEYAVQEGHELELDSLYRRFPQFESSVTGCFSTFFPQLPEPYRSRFSVRRCLGHGSFGRVWLAYDEHIRREVAIKIAEGSEEEPPILDPMSEVRQLAAAKSDGIVEIHDVIRADNSCPAIVMEFIDGVTLADALHGETLPLAEAAGILSAVAAALDVAHLAGVVHQDLKPSNILLDRDRNPHIVDFGLAVTVSGDSPAEAIGGSLPYMSPEQLSGSPVDQRSDIWTLGVILYQCLTGSLPFGGLDGKTADEVRDRILSGSRTSLAGIPLEVAKVVRHCLQQSKNDRFVSAREFATALRPFSSALGPIPDRKTRDAIRTRHAAEFFDFDEKSDFLPPLYALRLIEEARLRLPGKGYIHVQGPAGIGKSVLIRAMRDGRIEQSEYSTIAYSVLHGSPENPRLFLASVVSQILHIDKNRLLTSLDLPSPESTSTNTDVIRDSLATALQLTREELVPDGVLILAVDGLNEFTTSAANPDGPALLDVLPSAEELPDGCYILVSTRTDELNQSVTESLRCRSPNPFYQRVSMSFEDPGYRQLLRTYLKDGLSQITVDQLDALIDKMESRFLYVRFLKRLLRCSEESVRSTEIPDGDEVVGRYLNVMRKMVDSDYERFATWHQPIVSLIVAAYVPVTRQQLMIWLDVDTHDSSQVDEFERALSELKAILSSDELPADIERFQIGHQLLEDWMLSTRHADWSDTVQEHGHRRIVDTLKNDSPEFDYPTLGHELNQIHIYEQAFIPAHLIALDAERHAFGFICENQKLHSRYLDLLTDQGCWEAVLAISQARLDQYDSLGPLLNSGAYLDLKDAHVDYFHLLSRCANAHANAMRYAHAEAQQRRSVELWENFIDLHLDAEAEYSIGWKVSYLQSQTALAQHLSSKKNFTEALSTAGRAMEQWRNLKEKLGTPSTANGVAFIFLRQSTLYRIYSDALFNCGHFELGLSVTQDLIEDIWRPAGNDEHFEEIVAREPVRLNDLTGCRHVRQCILSQSGRGAPDVICVEYDELIARVERILSEYAPNVESPHVSRALTEQRHLAIAIARMTQARDLLATKEFLQAESLATEAIAELEYAARDLKSADVQALRHLLESHMTRAEARFQKGELEAASADLDSAEWLLDAVSGRLGLSQGKIDNAQLATDLIQTLWIRSEVLLQPFDGAMLPPKAADLSAVEKHEIVERMRRGSQWIDWPSDVQDVVKRACNILGRAIDIARMLPEELSGGATPLRVVEVGQRLILLSMLQGNYAESVDHADFLLDVWKVVERMHPEMSKEGDSPHPLMLGLVATHTFRLQSVAAVMRGASLDFPAQQLLQPATVFIERVSLALAADQYPVILSAYLCGVCAYTDNIYHTRGRLHEFYDSPVLRFGVTVAEALMRAESSHIRDPDTRLVLARTLFFHAQQSRDPETTSNRFTKVVEFLEDLESDLGGEQTLSLVLPRGVEYLAEAYHWRGHAEFHCGRMSGVRDFNTARQLMTGLRRAIASGASIGIPLEEIERLISRQQSERDSDVRNFHVQSWTPERNESCICGSRKKYKRCCLGR